MFDEELEAIKKRINEVEESIEEGLENAKDAILDTLYAMKKSIEKNIQKMQLELEVKRRFESHIDTHTPPFQHKGNEYGGELLRSITTHQKKINNVYEAVSSEKVQENFDKSIQKQMFLLDDFLLVVSTCRTRGFF